MCLLLETIRIENGIPQNLEFHQARFNEARKFHFRQSDQLELISKISCPQELINAVVKCRILFQQDIQSVTYEKYTPRLIQSLSLVFNDNIEYSWKFADRSIFTELTRNCNSDDILIVRKGLITDTSFANIVLFDGTKWLTPKSPLLKGCRREKLLSNGKLHEADISPNDLPNFAEARIINAMIDIFDHQAIAVDAIK